MSDDGGNTFRKPTWFNQFTTLRESRFVPPARTFSPRLAPAHPSVLNWAAHVHVLSRRRAFRPDGSRAGAGGSETIDRDPVAHANARPVIRMLRSFPSMTQSPSTREPRAAERKRHGDLAVIGLIGGIGGGKSECGRAFGGRAEPS